MRNNDFEDDGRTIVDMSGVERPLLLGFRLPHRKKESQQTEAQPSEASERPWEKQGLNKKQQRSYILGTVLAGLAIAGVFIAAGALFIYLLTLLWN